MKIDFKALKDQIDLVELLGRYTTLKACGTEFHGPCPFCHGDDRFVVIPAEKRWFCRKGDGHCGRHGDCFDFISEIENMDALQAAEYLSNGYLAHSDPVKPMKSAQDAAPTYAYDWGKQTQRLLASHEALLANKLEITDRCRDYLAGRGITEATIKAFRLGFEDKRLANSKRTALAISLPWFDEHDNLTAIKFRYLEPQTYVDDLEAAKPKPKERTETKTSRGSLKGKVFGWQAWRPDADTLIIVEGEFNALSIWQATPHAVLSLGSKSAFANLPAIVKDVSIEFDKVIVWTDELADSVAGAAQIPGALILVSQTIDGVKMDANACLQAGVLAQVLITAQPPPPAEETQEEPKRHSTYPYEVNRLGQMCYVNIRTDEETGEEKKTLTPLADFAAVITQEVTGEYGERYFKVEGKGLRGKTFVLDIPGEDFGDTSTLCKRLESVVGAKDTIYKDQRAHIGPAIKKLTPDDVKQTYVYNRTGWTTINEAPYFLIPGREPPDTEIKVAERLPYAFDKSADLALGIQGLELAMQFMQEHATIVLASYLLPPLAYHAKFRDKRYGLFLRGQTGSQKTSLAMLMMCLYGSAWNSENYLIKLGQGTTANAVMHMATQASDVPLMIDNYKSNTGGGSKELINLIHAMLEGGEKDRLTRLSELRLHRPIWAWPVFTGEDVPHEDAASLARMLVLHLRSNDPNNAADMRRLRLLRQAQEQYAMHFPAVGAAWVDWLVTPEAQEVIKSCNFMDERDNFATLITKNQPDAVNPYRIATNLALNHLTWTVLACHPTLGALAQKYEDQHEQALTDLAQTTVKQTAKSLDGQRFVSYLRSLIGSGRLHLSSKGGSLAVKTWKEPKRNPHTNEQDYILHEAQRTQQEVDHTIGWRDEEGGALILPVETLKLVKEYTGDDLSGISKNTLYEQLERMGYLGEKGKDSTTRTIRVLGENYRILHLNAKAMTEEE